MKAVAGAAVFEIKKTKSKNQNQDQEVHRTALSRAAIRHAPCARRAVY